MPTAPVNHDPFGIVRPLPFVSAPIRMRRGYPWRQPPRNEDYQIDPGGVPFVPPWAIGPGSAHPVRLSFEQLQRWYWRLDGWDINRDYTWITGRTAGSPGTPPFDGDPHVDSPGFLVNAGESDPVRFRDQRGRVEPASFGLTMGVTYGSSDSPYPGMLTLDFSDVLTEEGGPGGYWFYPYIRWDATALDSPATQIESSVQFWAIDSDGGSVSTAGPAELLAGNFTIDDGTGVHLAFSLYHNPGANRELHNLYYTTRLQIFPHDYLP